MNVRKHSRRAVAREKKADAPLSARFTDQEIAILREAAQIRRWSVAQVIRHGALELAATTLNKRKAGAQIARFLLSFLRELANPSLEIQDDPESTQRTTVGLDEYLAQNENDGDSHVRILKPDEQRWQRFARCARLLGAEFGPLLDAAIPIQVKPDVLDGLLDPVWSAPHDAQPTDSKRVHP